MATVNVALVDVVRKGKLCDRKQCPKTILPINLLSFLVSSSRIANGNLENSRIPLCQFDRDLRLQSEIIRFDRYRLQQLRSYRFVASLHIREVQIRDDIREKRQKSIPQFVSIQKD